MPSIGSRQVPGSHVNGSGAGPSEAARTQSARGVEVVIGRTYWITRGHGPAREATAVDCRTTKLGTREVYISFLGQDKRLDSWVPLDQIGSEVTPTAGGSRSGGELSGSKRRGEENGEQSAEGAGPSKVDDTGKRKRDLADLGDDFAKPGTTTTPSGRRGEASPSAPSTPEREHASMTRVRNFEDTRFGEYLIKTWYFSPYPMPTDDAAPTSNSRLPTSTPTAGSSTRRPRASDPAPRARGISEDDADVPHNSHLQSHLNPQGQGQHRPGQGGGLATRSASEMFAAGVGKGGDGARGRLWVCDLCFKYMRTRAGWDKHINYCTQLTPPGRRVYQRGSYTIWEVDGASATLYCQNLSLFGKLFIDHKSVFFHVENFMFYVVCDAATSRRDQVMAFFSKEKFSYDDYNLACIVTFPPFQNRGFAKLLIEFSYYLTRHPSTRPASHSPGTPERPLSDLGLKGYTSYWVSVVLRLCRQLLETAPLVKTPHVGEAAVSPVKTPGREGGRSLRTRKVASGEEGEKVVINGVEVEKKALAIKGQHSITMTLSSLAKACHIRVDDVALTLSELGFLAHRRRIESSGDLSTRGARKRAREDHTWRNGDEDDSRVNEAEGEGDEDGDVVDEVDLGEWKDVQVVISREAVDEAWEKWRVKEKGVLDEAYVLL